MIIVQERVDVFDLGKSGCLNRDGERLHLGLKIGEVQHLGLKSGEVQNLGLKSDEVQHLGLKSDEVH